MLQQKLDTLLGGFQRLLVVIKMGGSQWLSHIFQRWWFNHQPFPNFFFPLPQPMDTRRGVHAPPAAAPPAVGGAGVHAEAAA
jgi:hypothetical protein